MILPVYSIIRFPSEKGFRVNSPNPVIVRFTVKVGTSFDITWALVVSVEVLVTIENYIRIWLWDDLHSLKT